MSSGLRLVTIVALGASCAFAALGQPRAPASDARGDASRGAGRSPESARTLSQPGGAGPRSRTEGSASRGGDPAACDGGVVVDDGSAETGYGWVPSVIEGEFVQEFDAAAFSSHRLDSVCLCWIRTRPDTEIDFEIVFYRQVVDPDNATRLLPAAEPYAVFPGSADVVPKGIAESFFEVDVRGVVIPAGASYIGARWDPSTDQFFFVCTDTSDDTPPVEVFFRDDRAEGEWTSVFESNDPIFDDHRAIMVRALPGPLVAVDVPALGMSGLALMAAALATLALWLLIARRRWPGRP